MNLSCAVLPVFAIARSESNRVRPDKGCCGYADSLESQAQFAAFTFYEFVANEDAGPLLFDYQVEVKVIVMFQKSSLRKKSIEASRRLLRALPLVRSDVAPSPSEQAILERVIRAAALSGLHDLAWNYTVTGLFLDWGMLPSSKSQDHGCSCVDCEKVLWGTEQSSIITFLQTERVGTATEPSLPIV